MKELEDILSEVWREVGRHTDIRESVEELSALLHPIFHHSGIRVFLVGREEDHVEFVAGTCSRDAPPEHLHHLDREDAEELRQWCEGGQPLSDARRDGTHPADLVPGGCPGERTFTGPLYSERGVPGILLIWWMEPDHAPQRMQGLCRKLLEPFAVALENDRRLKELKALREAAEADKRALLTKLGRRQINDRIVGSEGGLKQVMDRVDLVAESDMPVLILGETGSGKEVIARAIHSRSARQEGPFIRVNCGAIPPELIDSELFGHEKGSFTGATSRRRGWFERADEGTLLLDEVAELPHAAQVRLLRVLEQGYLERVGAEEPTPVDVRIVAATHRDLAEMVQEGTFREDLWYRIVAFPVVIPPLRERNEDIAPLARHFARRAASRLRLPEQLPTEEDVELLKSYHWPGNVRELKSVIERAAILGNGEELKVAEALGAGETVHKSPTGTEESTGPSQNPDSPGDFPSLDNAIREHIKRALRHCGGQVEGDDGAAQLLDVNPSTLRSRMRRLDIDWTRYRGY